MARAPMSGDTTAVFVHESRFPLRILKHLVEAGPAGVGTQVKRLDALFRYESNAQDRSSEASTSYRDTPPVGSTGSRNATATSGSVDRGKGKSKVNFASTPSETERAVAHDQSYTRASGTDERDASKSEILTFESPIDGLVTEWCASEGEFLQDPYRPVLRILEPCKHPVQLGGLCAVCGKDLTIVDYTGFRETSRASISMAHDTANLTVSLEEAARLEKQTTSRLRKEKKLSLIVDLDQTIIHATVDPTVGDWMFDEKNPNYPVLRDVQRFKLLNDEGKEEGCWYYVKPRPKLPHFLDEASKIYELHVYTMGTRQYAENVCRIIDPDGRMFANRILSRDESGSMVRKSLERLFPVDQSMVVIIDDRADIWDWSPHLVKVVPYDFFVGIGDINSAFLPKQTSALAITQKEPAHESLETKLDDSQTTSNNMTAVTDERAAITEQNETLDHQILDKPLARMQEEKSAALHEALDHMKADAAHLTSVPPPPAPPSCAMNHPSDDEPSAATPSRAQDASPHVKTNSTSQIVSSSPSKQTQQYVNEVVSDSSDSESGSDDESDGDGEEDVDNASHRARPIATNILDRRTDTSPLIESPQRVVSDDCEVIPPFVNDTASIPPEEEAVLHDDDTELERVLDLLAEIHHRFYSTSDLDSRGVPAIIPAMKSEVLRGCNIVFSGVIPLDKTPETSEVWQLAEQFGAVCTRDLSKRTTHVIAARKGTSKVNSAQRRRDVSIVTLSWLITSVNLWRRQPETAYSLDPGSSPQDSDVPSFNNEEQASPQNGDGAQSTGDENEDELEEDDADLGDIDWGDAEAEIQAFLDETDDEDARPVDAQDRRAVKEDSTKPSADGRKRAALPVTQGDDAGSPLAKRRRVAAARAGRSKLKMSESASHLDEAEAQTSDDGEDEDLDDFAKALEGELM